MNVKSEEEAGPLLNKAEVDPALRMANDFVVSELMLLWKRKLKGVKEGN
jgi:hypothetical protein